MATNNPSQGARRFLSGYAHSLEEWQSPSHQAIRQLQLALEARSRKDLRAALVKMSEAGVDLNTFIIQDTPHSWFNLAPFFMSKGNALSAGFLEDLIAHPGVDLNQHQAQVFDHERRDCADNHPIVKPFLHTFLVGWSAHMGPLDETKQGTNGVSLATSRRRACHHLMDMLASLDLDWNKRDSQGNGVAHALFEYADGASCKWALSWLLERDLDLTMVNEAGDTPASFARARLARLSTSARKSDLGDVKAYEEALSLFEAAQLDATAAPASTKVIRPATRL